MPRSARMKSKTGIYQMNTGTARSSGYVIMSGRKIS